MVLVHVSKGNRGVRAKAALMNLCCPQISQFLGSLDMQILGSTVRSRVLSCIVHYLGANEATRRAWRDGPSHCLLPLDLASYPVLMKAACMTIIVSWSSHSQITILPIASGLHEASGLCNQPEHTLYGARRSSSQVYSTVRYVIYMFTFAHQDGPFHFITTGINQRAQLVDCSRSQSLGTGLSLLNWALRHTTGH